MSETIGTIEINTGGLLIQPLNETTEPEPAPEPEPEPDDEGGEDELVEFP